MVPLPWTAGMTHWQACAAALGRRLAPCAGMFDLHLLASMWYIIQLVALPWTAGRAHRQACGAVLGRRLARCTAMTPPACPGATAAASHPGARTEAPAAPHPSCSQLLHQLPEHDLHGNRKDLCLLNLTDRPKRVGSDRALSAGGVCLTDELHAEWAEKGAHWRRGLHAE